ncbi:MAG: hypothetical protein QOH88_339 [Verrucomicrobiota bacterium]|jgi:hypothetical protein
MPVPKTEVDQPRTQFFSPARGVLHAGIAILSFALVCTGLSAILPFPEINLVSRNLRFFQQHRDDFDTLFIGSSRIRHQISPAIFDRAMRDAGFPTHSLNLGINAMFPPEDGYFLENLLGEKPRRLKWVFIELNELQTTRVPELEQTQRLVYWHDRKRTSLLFRAILEASPHESGFSLQKKISRLLVPGPEKSEARDLLIYHGRLFARNFANVGRKDDLSRWISHLWKGEAPSRGMGGEGDGYVPQSRTMPAAETAIYEKELEQAMSDAEPRFVSPSTERACRALAEEVRKAGAVPIFLVPPGTTQNELGFRPESGIAGTVMSFNNARAYPQLYRSGMRINRGHLNAVAAEEFTRLVAENFSKLRRENKIQ